MTDHPHRVLDRTTFPIERGKVAEMARALFDDDPVYRDTEAATVAGYTAVPVPPTMSAVIDHWARGTADLAVDLGLVLERLLHGSTTWDYVAPVHAGQDVTATRRLIDLTEKADKRGGTMKFLTIETEFHSGDGETLLVRRDTLIEVAA